MLLLIGVICGVGSGSRSSEMARGMDFLGRRYRCRSF
jgi:hypothetical protein